MLGDIERTLVSFADTDVRSNSFESLSGKRPVSMNIATLSSFEEVELASDGGISAGRFVLEPEEVKDLMASTGQSPAFLCSPPPRLNSHRTGASRGPPVPA